MVVGGYPIKWSRVSNFFFLTVDSNVSVCKRITRRTSLPILHILCLSLQLLQVVLLIRYSICKEPPYTVSWVVKSKSVSLLSLVLFFLVFELVLYFGVVLFLYPILIIFWLCIETKKCVIIFNILSYSYCYTTTAIAETITPHLRSDRQNEKPLVTQDVSRLDTLLPSQGYDAPSIESL